jgi:hypothetical protein
MDVAESDAKELREFVKDCELLLNSVPLYIDNQAAIQFTRTPNSTLARNTLTESVITFVRYWN